jgi:Outer membrane protein beta-barrel domain
MRPTQLLLGALLCGASGIAPAQDQERRFYLGLDLGQGQIDRDYPAYSHGPRSNRESAAWKLRFGWALSPHWSFEAGYTDYGDYDGSFVIIYTGPLNQPIAAAPGDYSTSAKGFDLSTVGTWPLGEKFYLNASAGLLRREMKTVYAPFLTGAPGFRGKDGDLAIQYGMGFGFKLTDAWDLGVSWTTSDNLEGDFEFIENESDPTLLSLGIRYRM